MRRLIAVILFAAAIAACGADTMEPSHVDVSTTIPHVTESESRVPGVLISDPPAIATPLDEDLYAGFESTNGTDATLVAISLGELDVYDARGAVDPTRTLPATTILGTATVVTALSQPVDGWLEVMLPGRPNGSTGWVHTGRVDLYMVTDKVVIDLSDRELTYYQNGVEQLSTTVAIGTSHNPTPTGVFFVTDLVDIPGGGPWGPAALGLSARSDTITEFNGGDGIIGIHGTNKPGSIGQAASLGCVRLPNELIIELRGLVSLGTPVEIRA